MAETKSVAIIGAGIFGLSLAVALQDRNYKVTVFDRSQYDENRYDPAADGVQAASVDHNKIFRASYGTNLHYQRLAIEARKAWVLEDEKHGFSEQSDLSNDQRIFVGSGMLRVQPSGVLGALEKETLANMERDGLRDTQFVKGKPEDRRHAEQLGWKNKLLEFEIPQSPPASTYEAVLDSLAGFMRCSNACAYYQKIADDKGVEFHFGPEKGAVDSLVKSSSGVDPGKDRVTGIKSKDGELHNADVVVAGSS